MTSRAISWPGSCAPPCRNRPVRYVAGGAAEIRFEPGQGSASATAVERSRSILRVERAWQVAGGQRHQTYPRPALPPDDAGQNRAISSLDEKPDPAGQLLPARTARTEHRGIRQLLQQLSIPREPGQPDAG